VAAASGGKPAPFFLEVLSKHGFDGLPKPPTHFATNRITKVFQGIVNTYGIPRYGEANPALFTIITFPFLFGVMYGDVGHGFVLFLFGAWMLYNEKEFLKQPLSEMFEMAFKGRYMIFMMSIFAIYCGFIYNDFFSIGMNLFGSRWAFPHTNATTGQVEAVFLPPLNTDIYPLGIDPVWHISDNELLFFNSLKMKMSVILGITQMTFGLFLRVSNAVYFKSKQDLWLEAIPQVVFMLSLFGYMVLLILMKWSINWRAPGAGAPPSLIDTMINIALKPGIISDPIYAGQAGVQQVLLLIAFICVPIMLLGKPIMFKLSQKTPKKHTVLVSEEALASVGAGEDTTGSVKRVEGEGAHGSHGPEEHGHGFGEVFIHQAIETIEFVLGSVSNTASYLRLWALSLAHSQLATVFYERALVATVEMNSTMYVVIGYGAWALMTIAVLMMMDVLECFLHALRLHWVEFQNKFFKADGVKFIPFSFAELEAGAANDD
jgi:V-type H+-transporting ATPase subunit a